MPTSASSCGQKTRPTTVSTTLTAPMLHSVVPMAVRICATSPPPNRREMTTLPPIDEPAATAIKIMVMG